MLEVIDHSAAVLHETQLEENLPAVLFRPDVVSPYLSSCPAENWSWGAKSTKARGRAVDGETIYRLVTSVKGLSPRVTDIGVSFLCEAIQNVVQHSGSCHSLSPEWSAQVAVDSSTLIISVVDSGVGIPKSLFRRRAIRDSSDARSIVLALTPQCPSLGRGNGFANMLTWVDRYPGSELVVRSLAGTCTYRGGDYFESTDEVGFIQGTIVRLALAIPVAEARA